MDTKTAPNLLEIEQRRVQLEENVARSQKALRYWQLWVAEYEGFKEEVELKGSEPTIQQLIEVGELFGGDIVNETEVKKLVANEGAAQRSSKKIIDLVSKRVEQGQKNVDSIQKDIEGCEKRILDLPTITVPGLEDDGGLPLTEIYEELDEDGNIISSAVSEPGKAGSQIVDTLRKAGLTDFEAASDSVSQESKKVVDKNADPTLEPVSSPTISHAETHKTLSKSEDENAKQAALRHLEQPSLKFVGRETNDSTTSSAAYASQYELEDVDDFTADDAVMPEDEPLEDAQARREMVAYGLQEVGNVVAELNLEEGTESDWDKDDEDDEEDDEGDEDEDDEDEFGRSLRPQISASYRRKMQALEKRLNASMLENIGPDPKNLESQLSVGKNDPLHGDDNSFRKEAQTRTTLKTQERAQRKGVRFADSLDIAPAVLASDDQGQKQKAEIEKNMPPALAESVIERTATLDAKPLTGTDRKPSRFKREKASQPEKVTFPPPLPAEPVTQQPEPPVDRTLAETLVERPPSVSANNAPSSPDEMDPVLLKQQVVNEYFKKRNQMIQQQGGFTLNMTEEDDDQGPLYERREDGSTKKVSRFKASRIGRMGT